MTQQPTWKLRLTQWRGTRFFNYLVYYVVVFAVIYLLLYLGFVLLHLVLGWRLPSWQIFVFFAVVLPPWLAWTHWRFGPSR